MWGQIKAIKITKWEFYSLNIQHWELKIHSMDLRVDWQKKRTMNLNTYIRNYPAEAEKERKGRCMHTHTQNEQKLVTCETMVDSLIYMLLCNYL